MSYLENMTMAKAEKEIKDLVHARERRRIMQEENGEFQDFFESISVPMHIINGSGVILWANDAELDLIGYKKDQFIGKHISKFHSNQLIIQEMMHSLMNNQPVKNFFATLMCKNGDLKNVMINCYPHFKEDKLVHIRCVTNDITRYVQEDEKKSITIASLTKRNIELVGLFQNQNLKHSQVLKRNQDIFQKMIAEIQDYAILLLDKDGTIVTWNSGAERIKGYKQEEIIGQNFRIFYLPQDRQAKLPEKLIEIATIDGRALHEGLRVRKNGTTFWGNIVITALHNANKDVIGFCKVTRDLSDYKFKDIH